MLADGMTAMSTLGLAIAFWAGFRHLKLLLAASVVRSLGAGIQIPAVNAMFPQIVPQESLTKVQGVHQTINSVLLLLAPAVGGVVLGSMDIIWAFMIDVVTAILAVVILALIPLEKVARSEATASMFADLKQGIAYTLHHPLLRGLIVCCACSFFLITPATVLTPLLIERTFGDEVWRLTANEIIWDGRLVARRHLRFPPRPFRRQDPHDCLLPGCFGYLLRAGGCGEFRPIICSSWEPPAFHADHHHGANRIHPGNRRAQHAGKSVFHRAIHLGMCDADGHPVVWSTGRCGGRRTNPAFDGCSVGLGSAGLWAQQAYGPALTYRLACGVLCQSSANPHH